MRWLRRVAPPGPGSARTLLARFMLPLDRLIPPRFYAYARGLLSGIEPSQSWGIPPVA